jgi:hypothetical protein
MDVIHLEVNSIYQNKYPIDILRYHISQSGLYYLLFGDENENISLENFTKVLHRIMVRIEKATGL